MATRSHGGAMAETWLMPITRILVMGEPWLNRGMVQPWPIYIQSHGSVMARTGLISHGRVMIEKVGSFPFAMTLPWRVLAMASEEWPWLNTENRLG